MDGSFSVLFVCIGNICRSPVAQLILERQLEGTANISVASAGAHALEGEPMPEVAQQVGQRYGLTADALAAHRARQLEQRELESADLVLAMTRGLRRQVVELSPRTTKRVFTLLEFARLAKATTGQDLAAAVDGKEGSERHRAAVRAISLSRASLPPLADPAEIDVPDPHLQPEDVHVSSTLAIHRAVDVVADVLRRAAKG